jgi:hypothetical protein
MLPTAKGLQRDGALQASLGRKFWVKPQVYVRIFWGVKG